MSPGEQLLRSLVTTKPIPGGCERCNAVQTLREQSPGVYVNQIQHDSWCPVLRRIKRRRRK